LARATVHGKIHQDLLPDRVVIPDVVRYGLEVPRDLAGGRLQRDDAGGVEIVALAVLTIEIRGRVAGAPVDQVQLRIVGAVHPWRAPAVHPAVALPGVVAFLARPRNDVEPPALLARF